jgi:hypothetical protein
MTAIRSRRKCLNPFFIAAAALALALAGCGGDDEKSATKTGTSSSESTATHGETTATESTPTTETERETETETESETETSTSPEDQPGGPGDEEPARTLALFTGENGRITPRVVRVPAYISIRVELRARDGHEYGLSFAGKTLKVSGALTSVATTFDGLRPGARIVGTATDGTGSVRVEATAEPGP